MKCPECHAKFEYDDRNESVFADTSDLRLPVHGTVCPQCGLVQGEDCQRCLYCGKGMIGAIETVGSLCPDIILDGAECVW